ncbi:MAG TPA: helix-turn-helix domain-containing protein, partial [Thermoanaerobaculia bacterium]|nr:helix-turn-helix domain-containing protein [Thermoanaerobaculia bacterium]
LELPGLGGGPAGDGAAGRDAEGPSDYHRRVDGFRRSLVADALSESGGNRAEAARRLGLSRQALSYLARQLGLA